MQLAASSGLMTLSRSTAKAAIARMPFCVVGSGGCFRLCPRDPCRVVSSDPTLRVSLCTVLPAGCAARMFSGQIGSRESFGETRTPR
jgi:hypothetical protein